MHRFHRGGCAALAVAVGPRTAHDPDSGTRTVDAYRAWARRAGSQAAAFGGDAAWSAPLHILDAHAVVAAAGVGTPFALRFSFDVSVPPPAPIYLVVESPERFAVQ